MLSKFVLSLVLSAGMASITFAAGSSSSSSSSSAINDYERAVKAVDNQDYRKALQLLNRVVRKEPRNADAWNYVGYSHRKLNQFEPSLAAYQKALAINPNHRGANEYLGELYLQTGELLKAKQQLEKLKNVCASSCEEYDDLKKAIAKYEDG